MSNFNNNNNSSNSNTDNDTVPLLSGQNSLRSSHHQKIHHQATSSPREGEKRRRRRKLKSHTGHKSLIDDVSNTDDETDTTRDHITLPQHHDHMNITDFEQADSWGMLHESETGYGMDQSDIGGGGGGVTGNSLDDNDAFLDHRLSQSHPVMIKPKKKQKNTTQTSSSKKYPRQSNCSGADNDSIKSDPTLLMNELSRKREEFSKSPISKLSPSEVENYVRERKGELVGNSYHHGNHNPSNGFHNINHMLPRRKTYANDDVVIDVDALMKHVIDTNIEGNSHDHFSKKSSNTSIDDVDEDEYNSRPSSRGSSSNSSLDDVCLVLEDEENAETKIWPDVSVLEEFSKEEIERLRKQAAQDAEAFHFHYDEDESEDDRSNGPYGSCTNKNNNDNGIFFSQPIVTNIDVPELDYRKVNEAEHLSSGRLRPKKLAPWHLMQRPLPPSTTTSSRSYNNNKKNQLLSPSMRLERETMRDNFLVGRNIQYPPHIVSNNPEHFRFTYFRVDLDSTIHSPTISGLLQPGQKFQDLFVSSVYSQEGNINPATPATTLAVPSGRIPSMSPLRTASNNNNTTTTTTMGGTPVPLANLKDKRFGLSTTTGGGSTLSTTSLSNTPGVGVEDVSPFWLDVSNPTEEEMKVISKAFGIHPLTTEDIFLGEVREKVELFKDYYLICFRSFDIVAERHVRRRKEKVSLGSISERDGVSHTDNNNGNNSGNADGENDSNKGSNWFSSLLKGRRRSSGNKSVNTSATSYRRRKSILKKQEEKEKFKRKSGDRHKPREGELEPLNVYIIVFRTGLLTFHFAPTPHPINVRRRARLLKDYLTVTSDWIAYALIDDITDAFGPMIELIEDEVYEIEDAILKMNHSGDSSDSSNSSDSDDSDDSDSILLDDERRLKNGMRRRHSTMERRSINRRSIFSNKGSNHSSNTSSTSTSSSSSRSSRSSDSTFNANLIGWKKKGDMLRRIGECRKRVMSILRLLGSKADVIKGFSKRYNGQWDTVSQSEIGMYLGDIQDHIITMVSSLNHYEKLLSRSHSNYLAQINIDMTKVNNDMNDVLGKITILGTIVLPMNVITGLWGMNVIVPGQFNESLKWFVGILISMLTLAYVAYIYTKRRFGF
ncbi:putative Mg(2+) transporter MNR2 NDAI_0C00540 [Naumovozyma dairenensis CBS 421]|uniref:Manganese resistance protein MNR2 n=1 Tax=Naumovozyma dairenensis (strain ATCC 10597 / BCRC 20456 / CBS 421 / NBRC 0211 / NRRL Y-12639) TaxID=1071378 RepID=G0W7F4_NAUDC|nr:hypothetical protein NDAI_0C00540 [Naumovozyma dairenensis CBS 421]CCD23715.1 hypothetical protein NDAI_0C00540 [Naumovozyma dairenensis CBS 421]